MEAIIASTDIVEAADRAAIVVVDVDDRAADKVQSVNAVVQ